MLSSLLVPLFKPAQENKANSLVRSIFTLYSERSLLSSLSGGRFVLGLGAALASASAPAYTVELAHPSVRGLMAGMCNTVSPSQFTGS